MKNLTVARRAQIVSAYQRPPKLGGLPPVALRWMLYDFLRDALRCYGGYMERDEAEQSAAIALLLRVDGWARETEDTNRWTGQKRLYNVIRHVREGGVETRK